MFTCNVLVQFYRSRRRCEHANYKNFLLKLNLTNIESFNMFSVSGVELLIFFYYFVDLYHFPNLLYSTVL
jgi:hypothetical protein